jgi:hypothetical protein
MNSGKLSPDDAERLVNDVTGGNYRLDGHRIFRRVLTRDGETWVQLSNFSARITEEAVLDDGAESAVSFELAGTLATGAVLPMVRIPAGQFAGLNWILQHWGARAQIAAGQSARDHLRLAIQVLSPAPRRRVVYAHVGWREIHGQWVYLSATGAVGRSDVEVDLGAADLYRYALPIEPVDVPDAVRLSLQLLDVARPTITVPLLAAVTRAPLCTALPCDVSVFLEGATGTMKSTLAAIFLAHYGDFDRVHLPGSWASTANALERRAFTLKDTVFVVDDWTPGAGDPRDLQQRAERLLRAQGNLAGRARLRADLGQRPATPPRGVLIATGESHPAGTSLVARLVLVDIAAGAVDMERLTAMQAPGWCRGCRTPWPATFNGWPARCQRWANDCAPSSSRSAPPVADRNSTAGCPRTWRSWSSAFGRTCDSLKRSEPARHAWPRTSGNGLRAPWQRLPPGRGRPSRRSARSPDSSGGFWPSSRLETRYWWTRSQPGRMSPRRCWVGPMGSGSTSIPRPVTGPSPDSSATPASPIRCARSVSSRSLLRPS